ncbi:MAG: flagellar FliJ family protein [Hyphomonadaceae bacterium]|nr:flagellar FliJ family protein [Hyphomonadaceae bacterium]
MSKALRTLMRLARAEADAVRARLAEAQDAHVRALSRIALLEAGLIEEQGVAARSDIARPAYGPYAAARAEDRRVLNADERAFAAQADALRAELVAAHQEMKKFERLIELEEAREAEAERMREQAELDEIATMRAGRDRASRS